MALGESVEEAFYIIYHVQAACQIQVRYFNSIHTPNVPLMLMV